MAKIKKYAPCQLYRETILNHSGFSQNWHKHLLVLRQSNFYKESIPIGGDAPKSFIRVYEYGVCKKSKPKDWTAYIAKVGHKWYPIESITEYLMNRIGEVMGVQMAESKLAIANKQVRFLSKYFLNRREEELVHGAQIYAGHLGDEHFVDLANDRRQHKISRELFTFQFTMEAIKAIFPSNAVQIKERFIAMLLFDAVVGNNDRHFYNWGVIKHIADKAIPRFAPVYDSARGLFWNCDEVKIRSYLNHEEQLKKYIDSSMPRTGWEKATQINHFQLIEKMVKSDTRYRDICKRFLNEATYTDIERLIDTEFVTLMSKDRLILIKKCLTLRIKSLLTLLK